MADPYAARDDIAVGERPAGEGMLASVEALGGLAARSLADLHPSRLAAARFVAIVVRDETLLPPVARIDPGFAVMLLLRAADGCHAAAAGLDALGGGDREIFLVKEGLVAGPAGRAGAFAVEPAVVERVLVAALDGRVDWERDPDFGYGVPARVGDLDADVADALLPRLLYAGADRVYEHAEAVAALKRARHRRVSAVAGVDQRVLDATGWPIEPTGSGWKD